MKLWPWHLSLNIYKPSSYSAQFVIPGRYLCMRSPLRSPKSVVLHRSFTTATMVAQGYKEAIEALNGLQTNAAVLQNARTQSDRCHTNLPATIKYLSRAGITLEQLDTLSVIHITGTKGKGSTCAFTERLLREYGYSTGMYTSPHLVSVTERIRLNGQPIHQDEYTKYFWKVYNDLYSQRESAEDMPAYFKFLTVLALKVFLEEGVDVAVIEVGIGGEYDCTNVVRNPVVCGITSLDIDHTSILGNTIASIAWHKAGIIKVGAGVFTASGQDPDAMEVLQRRAKEKRCDLRVCPPVQEYGWCSRPIHMGLAGQMQLVNASLALQLVHYWLHAHQIAASCGPTPAAVPGESSNVSTAAGSISTAPAFTLSEEDLLALCEVVWPGRSQVLHYNDRFSFYLDGAHTSHSMEACAAWFQSVAHLHAQVRHRTKRVFRVLLFNSTGDRDAQTLLAKLQECDFDLVIFTTNITAQNCQSSDQTNLTVSETSQHLRCQRHLEMWQLLRARRLAASSTESTNLMEDCNNYANSINNSASFKTNGCSMKSSDSFIKASSLQHIENNKEESNTLHDKSHSCRLHSLPASTTPLKGSLPSVSQSALPDNNILKTSPPSLSSNQSFSPQPRLTPKQSAPATQTNIFSATSRSNHLPPSSPTGSLDATHMLQFTQAFSDVEQEDVNAVVFPYIKDALDWLSSRSALHHPPEGHKTVRAAAAREELFSDHNRTSLVDLATADRFQLSLSEADHVQVLVTGSLHLVGGVLALLDPTLSSAAPRTLTAQLHKQYICSSSPGVP